MNKNKIWAMMLDTKVLYRSLLLCALSIAVYMASGTAAYAFNFCVPVDNILGSLLPGMATLGVIIIGIGAMLGRIQWQTAILCAIGISIAFGYSTIIPLFGGHSC